MIINMLISVYNYIMGGTHPSNKNRIKNIVKIMTSEYAEKYNLKLLEFKKEPTELGRLFFVYQNTQILQITKLRIITK